MLHILREWFTTVYYKAFGILDTRPWAAGCDGCIRTHPRATKVRLIGEWGLKWLSRGEYPATPETLTPLALAPTHTRSCYGPNPSCTWNKDFFTTFLGSLLSFRTGTTCGFGLKSVRNDNNILKLHKNVFYVFEILHRLSVSISLRKRKTLNYLEWISLLSSFVF